MYDTTMANNLRHWFIDLPESEIWKAIEPFQTQGHYDYQASLFVIPDECKDQIIARAEALARGEILPANPEFVYISK